MLMVRIATEIFVNRYKFVLFYILLSMLLPIEMKNENHDTILSILLFPIVIKKDKVLSRRQIDVLAASRYI